MSLGILRFFFCGHGDTILIESSPGKPLPSQWGLVDCRLTKSSGAYDRIRTIIREKKITQLEFVCLTHPDRDHYFGMLELLKECFCDEAGDRLRVNQFWDSGVHPKLFTSIAKRLGKKNIKQEIDSLYRFLVPLIMSDHLGHEHLTAGKIPRIPFGPFDFISLSPRANRVDRYSGQKLDEAVKSIKTLSLEDARHIANEANNELSVVLVLMHRDKPVNIVLGGDAPSEAWTEALAAWEQLASTLRRDSNRFTGVKVSHHAANNSLAPSLYQAYCEPRNTKAILSVGPDDPKHPDPRVLAELKKRGVTAYRTCWPEASAKPARASLPLPGVAGIPARQPQLEGYDWADIEVTIQNDGSLTVNPPQCLFHWS